VEVLGGSTAAGTEDIAENDLQQAHERVTVLDLKGPLDMASAPAFRRRVRQLVSAGVSQMVIDLGDVSFVDSSGLGAVIGALKLVRERGGDLRIVRANEQVQQLLGLTSLDQVLRPYPGADQVDPAVDAAHVLEIECLAGADQLEIIHEALASFWAGMRAPPDEQPKMMFEIAICEIAANIVEHARPHLIHLRLTENHEGAIADFWDTGLHWAPPDEPVHATEPGDGPDEIPDEPDELAERGRGLAIARAAVDVLRYERDGGINRWSLLKRL
jgi:anti-sigma B factor antagonist